ncbi:AI-2E family transporter [Frigidibacter sp. ROC022]|uniref:AI-2E family transporter n=1 Tax=Frigidibacter sp. ROC022 TaxID=2971796 RepID=UPI00215A516F|nr:AI-2E family transporter [Frigidibacter sp. ROC022]MCR8722980.1 AI-2E family transporter [Frigidibacter sp. ROC022]
MALPVRQQVQYWGAAAAVVFLVLYTLGNVILPFVLGGAIAYVLDPIADRLQKLGLSRAAATVTITLVGLLFFALAVLLVVPTLVTQTAGLVETVPKLVASLQAFVTERFPSILDEGSTLRQSLNSLAELIRSRGGELVQGLVSSALSLVNGIVLLVLVPVITFYLLLDWDRMLQRLDALLPREHAPVIREVARDIDRTLASFIRGQGTVCLILGTFYALALMLVGLQFGALIGALAGLLTFIPYVGALVGGVMAIGLAFFQYWGEWWWIVTVAGIFFFGQFAEGNILTPKLVGQSVGLHPVWLIFALSAFGTLFGFVGMLVAVPVAASLGVITRFGLEQYRESSLYRGSTDHEAEP